MLGLCSVVKFQQFLSNPPSSLPHWGDIGGTCSMFSAEPLVRTSQIHRKGFPPVYRILYMYFHFSLLSLLFYATVRLFILELPHIWIQNSISGSVKNKCSLNLVRKFEHLELLFFSFWQNVKFECCRLSGPGSVAGLVRLSSLRSRADHRINLKVHSSYYSTGGYTDTTCL